MAPPLGEAGRPPNGQNAYDFLIFQLRDLREDVKEHRRETREAMAALQQEFRADIKALRDDMAKGGEASFFGGKISIGQVLLWLLLGAGGAGAILTRIGLPGVTAP